MKSVIWILGLGFAITVAAPVPVVAKEGERQMERQSVTGIGGLFVRAQDPAALAAWYEKHLGINPIPQGYDDEPWIQDAGPTIFGPIPADDAGMMPADKGWMLNLRVADIEAMVAQLQAEGIKVTLDPETYPNGRFAGLTDPEGNPIQLWQVSVPE